MLPPKQRKKKNVASSFSLFSCSLRTPPHATDKKSPDFKGGEEKNPTATTIPSQSLSHPSHLCHFLFTGRQTEAGEKRKQSFFFFLFIHPLPFLSSNKTSLKTREANGRERYGKRRFQQPRVQQSRREQLLRRGQLLWRHQPLPSRCARCATHRPL